MKYNKSRIMKRAWKLKEELNSSFSTALKISWNEEKRFIALNTGEKVKFNDGMEITVEGYTRTLKRWTKGNYDRIYINNDSKSDGFVDIKNKTANLKSNAPYQVKMSEIILNQLIFESVEKEQIDTSAKPIKQTMIIHRNVLYRDYINDKGLFSLSHIFYDYEVKQVEYHKENKTIDIDIIINIDKKMWATEYEKYIQVLQNISSDKFLLKNEYEKMLQENGIDGMNSRKELCTLDLDYKKEFLQKKLEKNRITKEQYDTIMSFYVLCA